MNNIVKTLEEKLESLGINLPNEDLSAILAGLNDILEAIPEIEKTINEINSTDDTEKIAENLVDLQIELVNHLKVHIIDMEEPLMKLVNSIDDKL
jgi:NTP pyrophosphatase (non-canonical NTP hydrolase)